MASDPADPQGGALATPGRLASGVPGLDEVLGGGVLPGRSYLVLGQPGSGKTILALQWLNEGLRRGENVLYLTIGEPSAGIIRNAESFSWDVDEIPFVDAVKVDARPSGEEYRFLRPSEVEGSEVWNRIHATVEERAPDRLVLDSLTNLRHLSVDDFQFRRQILDLFARLADRDGTTFATFDALEYQREAVVAMAVDGVIRLDRRSSPSRTVGLRSVEIDKQRGSDFLSGEHAMQIDGDGIRIFPHRIERAQSIDEPDGVLASGIPELDQLLRGGVPRATTTLVTGPTGIGKSTLSTSFLVSRLKEGGRAVIYSFEEPREMFLARSRGVGLDLSGWLDSGALDFRFVNPLEVYPDQFLAEARREIDEQNRDFLLIDSLRGYRQVMAEFGSELAHLKNLLTFSLGRGTTVFLLYEMERITGDLMATEMGMSHLVDNVLLLRYAERRGQITRVLGCLKKRLGPFEPELREYELTEDGLEVGDRLDYMEGILSGATRIRDRKESGAADE